MNTNPPKPTTIRRPRAAGFSLIELMVVMAIVAILAAIAYPSYTDYVVKGRRADVKTTLMKGALWMERNQTAAFSYSKDAGGTALTSSSLDDAGLGRSPENAATAAAAHYAITLSTIAANTFEIRATAQGGQATKDAACKILVLNHLGQRGIVSGTTVDFTGATAKACWAQ
jgi:type IV pilus assembly protein PilE